MQSFRLLLLLGTPMLSSCLALGIVAPSESSESDVGTFAFVTREEVIKRQGQPDSIGRYKKCEVLTYYDGLTWAGAAVFIYVVPIPLVVPIGRDEERMYIRDGYLMGQVTQGEDVSYAFGHWCPIDGSCHFVAGRENRDNTSGAEASWCE